MTSDNNPGIRVQICTDADPNNPREGYRTVDTVHMPQVPGTGEWIDLPMQPTYRVMRVWWFPPQSGDSNTALREGGAMLLVRPEPVYDFPSVDVVNGGSVTDPYALENGVLGGRPAHVPNEQEGTDS